MKKSADSKKEPTPVKCDECKHFTGLAYAHEFGCAKGHAPENQYLLTRRECEDHMPMSRPEMIFKRFGISSWTFGVSDVKNRQASTRRTATALRKTASSLEKYLSAEQVEAFAIAAKALDQLGNDFEVAARMAVQYKADKEAQWERERLAELDAIADAYLGIAGPVKVLEVAGDLNAFFANEGRDWYRNKPGNQAGHYFYCHEPFQQRVDEYNRVPGDGRLRDVKRVIASGIKKLGARGRDRLDGDPTVTDFEQFCIWRRSTEERARLIAADPKVVELRPR